MSRLALLIRLLLCVALLLIHHFLLFLPISELFLISILLVNRSWFGDFLSRIARERNNRGEVKLTD